MVACGGADRSTQLRMDHSRALGRAPDPHLGGVACVLRRIDRCNRDDRMGRLDPRVGGHHGAHKGLRVLLRAAHRCLQLGHCGDDFLGGKGNADDSSGRGKDLVEDAAEALCRGHAGGHAALDARRTVGAVGVAGVDQHRRDASSGGREMPPANRHGGRNHAVGGKHGRANRRAGRLRHAQLQLQGPDCRWS